MPLFSIFLLPKNVEKVGHNPYFHVSPLQILLADNRYRSKFLFSYGERLQNSVLSKLSLRDYIYLTYNYLVP